MSIYLRMQWVLIILIIVLYYLLMFDVPDYMKILQIEFVIWFSVRAALGFIQYFPNPNHKNYTGIFQTWRKAQESSSKAGPLLLNLDVQFTLHDSRVYKDVKLDNKIQLSNNCPVQSDKQFLKSNLKCYKVFNRIRIILLNHSDFMWHYIYSCYFRQTGRLF